MSLYAIGDIHGTLGALKTIFKQNLIKKDDTVVFLGDYVDRGIDSKGTIDWLINNSADYNFIFLKGNHEIMMLNAKTGYRGLTEWLRFGGAQTLDSYGIGDDPDWESKISAIHWAFLENSKPYYEMGDYIFVHAGLESGIALADQSEHHLFWKKYEIPESYGNGKKVICGHTSRKNGEIADFGHTLCIDTYAYGGMWLSCLNVETGDFLKAKANGAIEKGKL